MLGLVLFLGILIGLVFDQTINVMTKVKDAVEHHQENQSRLGHKL